VSDRNVLDGLNVYVVGGAVRDELLGLPPGDRDWVVVGSTPEEMINRGFVPVGGDFPVFLHPVSKEEYALARTERKSGRGYKGFTFYTGADVTLEADLSRRDLTINAMARGANGLLVDPLNGSQDLKLRVFRHVGPAFEEDPVRVLRLARFAARFTNFTLAEETLALCQRMTDSGEVSHLVPERVWQEIARGLLSEQPSRMLEVLAQSRASAHVLPDWVDSPRVRQAVDQAAKDVSLPLHCRYGLLCLDTADTKALSHHLRVPTECADMARLLPIVIAGADATVEATSAAEFALGLIEMCDGLRKPERFELLLRTAAIVTQVDIPGWLQKLNAVRGVDAGSIAASLKDAALIKAAVRQARLAALQSLAARADGVDHPG